jgi:predicted kinase
MAIPMAISTIPEEEMLEPEPVLLRRVRLRAGRRVLWLRHLWSQQQAEGEHWLAISHSEVDRILEGTAALSALEAQFYASDPQCQEMTSAIAAADDLAAGQEALDRLGDEFGLNRLELDLLSLAVAVELDPPTRRLLGYLQDSTVPTHASAWTAAAVFGWPAGFAIAADSPLITSALARPVEAAADPACLATEWAADPALSRWLAFGTDPIAGTGPAVRRVNDSQAMCLYAAQLEEMASFLSAMGTTGPGPHAAIELELVAPVGSGKATLAAQLCAALRCGLVAVDVGELFEPPAGGGEGFGAVLRAATAARLTRSAVYWHGLEALEARVEGHLHGLVPLAIFGSSALRAGGPRRGVVRRSFVLPPLTRAARCELWSRCSSLPVPDSVRDCALTPGELMVAAAAAPAGPDAVSESCRRILHADPGDVFTPLALPYGWDDIVLTPSLRAHLEEFQAQAQLRGAVYEEWGFGRLVPLGKGVTALFAGPSGTGKTMAAQVLARCLGMQLYRVDLAGVVNKYIGETEKRLKRVFDSCERANVLLLFDEADALFGKRTQVKDAHDRFANIEIDYLLQRMEQFDGVAVLATNRKRDMDSAFLRRLRFVVDFVPPGPDERRSLWRLSLGGFSPHGEALLAGDIDWEFLARRLELNGAGIKAASLAAAFLARAEGTTIGMRHILHACGRELTKIGVELPLDARGG